MEGVAALMFEKVKQLSKDVEKIEKKSDENDKLLIKYEAWRTMTGWLIGVIFAILGLLIAYLSFKMD